MKKWQIEIISDNTECIHRCLRWRPVEKNFYCRLNNKLCTLANCPIKEEENTCPNCISDIELCEICSQKRVDNMSERS